MPTLGTMSAPSAPKLKNNLCNSPRSFRRVDSPSRRRQIATNWRKMSAADAPQPAAAWRKPLQRAVTAPAARQRSPWVTPPTTPGARSDPGRRLEPAWVRPGQMDSPSPPASPPTKPPSRIKRRIRSAQVDSDVVDSRRLKDLVLWRAYAPEPEGGWPEQLAQKARATSRNDDEDASA